MILYNKKNSLRKIEFKWPDLDAKVLTNRHDLVVEVECILRGNVHAVPGLSSLVPTNRFACYITAWIFRHLPVPHWSERHQKRGKLSKLSYLKKANTMQ